MGGLKNRETSNCEARGKNFRSSCSLHRGDVRYKTILNTVCTITSTVCTVTIITWKLIWSNGNSLAVDVAVIRICLFDRFLFCHVIHMHRVCLCAHLYIYIEIQMEFVVCCLCDAEYSHSIC